MTEKTTIRVPARLSAGDTIGIVAPAGPFDRDTFARGTRSLEDLGFKVFTPPGLLDANGYLAGSVIDDRKRRHQGAGPSQRGRYNWNCCAGRPLWM